MESVVCELEGTLLKSHDTFPYFMLVAFEASGLIRFTTLLILWPLIKALELFGKEEIGLKVMIFAATAGVPVAEIEAVARAVLPKFFIEDVELERWRLFSSFQRRVVVTRMPGVMVERFAKEHLLADDVVGCELAVNRRFGLATGSGDEVCGEGLAKLFVDVDRPSFLLGVGSSKHCSSLISLCKEELQPPLLNMMSNNKMHKNHHQTIQPPPVIFHDGRLARRPTPSTSLLILVWIPIGIALATIRILIGMTLPLRATFIVTPYLGGQITVNGKPPPPASASGGGVLFVCTHRTLMDPVVLATALGRKVPTLTYSISRFTEIISPILSLRLTRVRETDARMIKQFLENGDLTVCPEGTTCREPFLLRFSALFAELADRIVPVAMNYKPDLFNATTARGWKAMDPIFFFMNPRLVYEVTFLDRLPVEKTCTSGKSPYEVANYVQKLLATTLGFECTNYTRKDKYRVLAGNDGTVSYRSS